MAGQPCLVRPAGLLVPLLRPRFSAKNCQHCPPGSGGCAGCGGTAVPPGWPRARPSGARPAPPPCRLLLLRLPCCRWRSCPPGAQLRGWDAEQGWLASWSAESIALPRATPPACTATAIPSWPGICGQLLTTSFPYCSPVTPSRRTDVAPTSTGLPGSEGPLPSPPRPTDESGASTGCSCTVLKPCAMGKVGRGGEQVRFGAAGGCKLRMAVRRRQL